MSAPTLVADQLMIDGFWQFPVQKMDLNSETGAMRRFRSWGRGTVKWSDSARSRDCGGWFDGLIDSMGFDYSQVKARNPD
jgi:hypothetical protein